MTLLVAILLVAAVGAGQVMRLLGRATFFVLAAAPAAGFAWVLAHRSEVRVESTPWIPALGIDIDFRLDELSAFMALIVLGGGALVLAYCARYFTDDDDRLGDFAAKMTAFTGAMLGLVLADNMLLMYVFWEATSVLSFLLVGHFRERASSRRAAGQALMVTTLGGLAMLVGIIGLGEAAGSYLFSEVVAAGAAGSLGGPLVATSVFCILAGALSKSAIVPLHFWLPGAMAAPTPVSAYLHSAAMVKAGVFLIARLAPGFADVPGWRLTVVALGLLSLLLAGWRALHEFDLKLILAFGTVSQLGLLTVAVGIGTRDTLTAGLTMMLAHSLFKAALFMVVGIIDHSTGTRDIRVLSGLGRRAPTLALVATFAAGSMAGFPPLLGFVGKEAVFTTVLHEPALHGMPGKVIVAGLVTGSILTVAYSLRFLYGAFGVRGGALSSGDGASPAVENMGPRAYGILFLGPPALLAVAGIAFGLRPAPVVGLVTAITDDVPAGGAAFIPSSWHGFGAPLLLSAIVLTVGIGIHLAERHIERVRFEQPALGNADRIYDAVLDAADTASLRLTAATQRGSLPLTQTIVFLVFVSFPGISLLVGDRAGLRMDMWDSPAQAVVALPVAAAALATVVLRNRLAAVLTLGVTGYGTGLLFAFHGAPDLALTQFLVETLLLVVFVLVLRKLPAEAPATPHLRRSRAFLAGTVGLTVAVLGAYAVNARATAPVSAHMQDLALRIGGGANAVNVLLVDIRAWDTLGEISVLVAAATGVASLVFRSHRFGRSPRVSDVDAAPSGRHDEVYLSQSSTTWLRANRYYDPRHRSFVLEVATRLLFPTIMVFSLFFLFAGHNNPGGGFAGGLTAGLALVLRYFAGGRYELGEALPVDAGRLLGVGLTLAVTMALAPLLLGYPPLTSAIVAVDLPVFGTVKLVSALVFDIGVYLIVVGLVLDVLRSLGVRLEYSDALADIDPAAELPDAAAAPHAGEDRR